MVVQQAFTFKKNITVLQNDTRTKSNVVVFRVDYSPARHQRLVPTQLHPQQALTLELSQEPAIVYLQSRSQHLVSERDSTQQQHLQDLEVSP